MFMREDYLKLLYPFLEVASDFIPSLRDGNEKRIREMTENTKPYKKLFAELGKTLGTSRCVAGSAELSTIERQLRGQGCDSKSRCHHQAFFERCGTEEPYLV